MTNCVCNLLALFFLNICVLLILLESINKLRLIHLVEGISLRFLSTVFILFALSLIIFVFCNYFFLSISRSQFLLILELLLFFACF